MVLPNFDLSSITSVDFTNMTPYELARNVFLPFILVFVILWVVLERIHIFGKRVNIVISLGISILLATTPAFTMFSTYITEVSGTGMIMIFGILIIGGTAMWALFRGRDIYYEQSGSPKKLEKLYKKKEKYLKKARAAEDRGDTRKRNAYMKVVRELEDRIDMERGRR